MEKIEKHRPLLSHAKAEKITDWAERAFALRCLAVGCLVWHQVPVGSSVIDFLVVNPKRGVTKENKGTLVEVTLLRKANDLFLTGIPRLEKAEKKPSNKTARRKARQLEAMKKSGYRWTVLYKENMKNITAGNSASKQITSP